MNVGDGGEVSAIWQNLWGTSTNNNNNNSNTNQFPLLTELKNELNKASLTAVNNVVMPEESVDPPADLKIGDSVESPELNSNL